MVKLITDAINRVQGRYDLAPTSFPPKGSPPAGISPPQFFFLVMYRLSSVVCECA